MNEKRYHLAAAALALAAGLASPAFAAPPDAAGAVAAVRFAAPQPAEPPEHAFAAWTGRVDLEGLPRTLERGETARVGLSLPVIGEAVAEVSRAVVGPRGGVAWSGRFADGSGASFVFAQFDDAVAGAVWHPRLGVVEIRPTGERNAAGDQVSRVLLVDPETEVSCGAGDIGGLLSPTPQVEDRGPAAAPMRRGVVTSPAGLDAPPEGCGDDGSVIDIMVVWTVVAAGASGGSAAMEALALASVESVNLAFINSDLGDLELRLVHTHETDFLELADEPNARQYLARMSNPTDGLMDEIPVLRDQYKADLVALLVDSFGPGLGGIGNSAMGAPEFGYSATREDLALSPLVFAHEIGHNLGFHHDVPFAPLADHFYAIGHKFTPPSDVLRRTIMAYTPGTVVPHFSNPDVTFNGVPTGTPLDSASPRHNVQVMRETRRSIANFRQSDDAFFDCNANGIDDATEIASGAAPDENGNAQIDSCEIRLYVDADAPPGGDGLSWETAFNDLSDAIGTPRYLCDPVTEVWIAGGVYRPTGPNESRWDRFFVGPHMRLLGGFAGGETSADQRDPVANPTVLSGDRLGNDLPNFGNRSDNSYNVVRLTGVHPTSLLDGIIIRGGHADFDPFGQGFAAGLVGGAVNGLYSSASIRNTIIEDNFAHVGVTMLTGGDAMVANTLIRNNRAWPVATNLPVGVAGILFYDRARTTVVNSTITGNESPLGLAAAAGLGLGSEVTIVNSIISDNPTGFSPPIFVNLDPTEIPSSLVVRSSLVEGGASAVLTQPLNSLDYGPSNIDADPLFVDAAGGDHSLATGSPAIDSGDSTAVPAGLAIDLAGNDRISGAAVDMGAYEVQVPGCPADLNGDGVLDLADVQGFVSGFLGLDPAADLAEPFGVFDLADVFAFVASFSSGCP